jgi:hypothetical protein
MLSMAPDNNGTLSPLGVAQQLVRTDETADRSSVQESYALFNRVCLIKFLMVVAKSTRWWQEHVNRHSALLSKLRAQLEPIVIAGRNAHPALTSVHCRRPSLPSAILVTWAHLDRRAGLSDVESCLIIRSEMREQELSGISG